MQYAVDPLLNNRIIPEEAIHVRPEIGRSDRQSPL